MRNQLNCFNTMEFRARARRRLPAPLFHYIDGGADDEWSLHNNTRAFDKYEFLPNQLNDVSSPDSSVRVFGASLAMPLILSPTGMTRLFHHSKELAVARAADRSGVMYTLSTMGTTSLEDIAQATVTPKMFQIYVLKDRGLTTEFVDRCKSAGYTSLCLTVDTAVAGNRERDKRLGMTMPPKLTFGSALSFCLRPSWTFNFIKDPDFRLANVVHKIDALENGSMGLIDYVNSQFDRTVTWDDCAAIIEQWGGPFVIKGLLSPGDAKRAVDVGATGIMISNHGGRQLDAASAPVDCVRPIRETIGNQLDLVVDGGVRRGTHILKSIALGANACSIGRPYLYALAAYGEAGVDRMLNIFREEIERSMSLLGISRLAELNENHLVELGRISRHGPNSVL